MSSPSESQLNGLPGYDPDNIQPWIVQVVVSMTILALLAVGLRLLSRHLNSRKLWWDDWMVVFSMCWNLAVVGFIFAMYSCGMGIHADLVPPGNIVMMAKWLIVAEILYAFNLVWTKLSLLLMYYRIFHIQYFKKTAWVIGVFIMAWVICITFLFVFICVPVEKLWYPELPGCITLRCDHRWVELVAQFKCMATAAALYGPGQPPPGLITEVSRLPCGFNPDQWQNRNTGRCINQVSTWIANSISTIFTDLIILLLPIPQVWKLHMSRWEKSGITAAFALGLFVVFASAYRTYVLFTYNVSDPTYTLAPTVGWTAIEMSAGIVSACLPTMLPVFYFLGRYIGISSLAATMSRMRLPGFASKMEKSMFSNEPTSRDGDAHLVMVPFSTGSTDCNAFYRLPEEADSHDMIGEAGSGGAARIEHTLRYGMVLRYDKELQREMGRRDDERVGDIPLKIICVPGEI